MPVTGNSSCPLPHFSLLRQKPHCYHFISSLLEQVTDPPIRTPNLSSGPLPVMAEAESIAVMVSLASFFMVWLARTAFLCAQSSLLFHSTLTPTLPVIKPKVKVKHAYKTKEMDTRVCLKSEGGCGKSKHTTDQCRLTHPELRWGVRFGKGKKLEQKAASVVTSSVLDLVCMARNTPSRTRPKPSCVAATNSSNVAYFLWGVNSSCTTT